MSNIYIISIIILFFLCETRTKQIRHGRYTRDLLDYHLTVPYKSNSNGNFQSFNLPHFYTYAKMQRNKRNTENAVFYRLMLFDGNEIQIEIWPNFSLIIPDTITEHHYPGSEQSFGSRHIAKLDSALCHYTGSVRDDPLSSVALSCCDGLVGYIKLNNTIYFIEPVLNYGPNEHGHHLHIIHEPNKSSHQINKRRCATTGNWIAGWEQAIQNYFKIDAKRFAVKKSLKSNHHFLETLVVADKKFIDYHKDTDIENYILTIMNMVSNFYHDATIGNQIDVTVVRIIYLDREVENFDLEISTDASNTLKSFCRWQHEINPKDVTNSYHHDIALLLTRHDICAEDIDAASNCNMMGLANVATACNPPASCAINEDAGLVLGFTIAHEIGHVLGSAHDSLDESGCEPQADNDKSYYFMSPYVKMASHQWSPCSRRFVTEFFEAHLGDCLLDEPTESAYKDVDMLPGAVYDTQQQCQFIYENVTSCEIDGELLCSKLFCKKNSANTCFTNGEPPADGTKCGHHKWCFKQKCVNIGERLESVVGDWGPWGDWSECSRSCGGGVQTAERFCDNPAPQYGGRYCLGDRKKAKICNTSPCPFGSESFRSLQCSKHNLLPWNGKLHQWKPFMGKMAESPCVLYCLNEVHVYSKLSSRVIDGTPCKAGTNFMCIAGECREVGCDWVLDSNLVEDECGICNGNGGGCQRINGTFDRLGRNYEKVTKIPQGARNIEIVERFPSENTIAIANVNDNEFYLNGDNTEEPDGEKDFSGNIALYTHPQPNLEKLFIKGPINEDLNFYVRFYTNKNIGYEFSYFLRQHNQSSSAVVPFEDNDLNYKWEYVDWTSCSKKCGSGESKSEPVCVNAKNGGEISNSFCEDLEKPKVISKICNNMECKVRWHKGPWSLCTGCLHHSGSQKRDVWCARESPRFGDVDILTEDDECIEKDGIKPLTRQLCVGPCTKHCRVGRSTEDSSQNHETFLKLFEKLNDFFNEPVETNVNIIECKNNDEPLSSSGEKCEFQNGSNQNIDDDNCDRDNNGSINFNVVDNEYSDYAVRYEKNDVAADDNTTDDSEFMNVNWHKKQHRNKTKYNPIQKFMFLGHPFLHQINSAVVAGTTSIEDDDKRNFKRSRRKSLRSRSSTSLNSKFVNNKRQSNRNPIIVAEDDQPPQRNLLIEEINIKSPSLTSSAIANLSDLGFEKFGDQIAATVDLLHRKIYRGDVAMKKIANGDFGGGDVVGRTDVGHSTKFHFKTRQPNERQNRK